ncbi:hypothetical protein [Ensifer sp. M14]|uniref:hypothetical protein n=1 Tax=Ensifer sp. M14 TaxID=2203782 RepID=UPI0011C01929|nr:hypothetical protein [Ensifer sp. M14]
MGLSLMEIRSGLREHVQKARGDAVRATVATSVGLTALGLVFSYQGPWLGVAAVLLAVGLWLMARRLVSPTISLIISAVALCSYVQLDQALVSTF